jgi:hypothetical protein
MIKDKREHVFVEGRRKLVLDRTPTPDVTLGFAGSVGAPSRGSTRVDAGR